MDDQAINRKIKIGDKVVCINDFHREGKQIFMANRFYFVRDLENYKNYDLVKIDNTWFAFDKITELEFGSYFKTLAEYREKRIDEILDEQG
jgi:hypothetical protein